MCHLKGKAIFIQSTSHMPIPTKCLRHLVNIFRNTEILRVTRCAGRSICYSEAYMGLFLWVIPCAWNIRNIMEHGIWVWKLNTVLSLASHFHSVRMNNHQTLSALHNIQPQPTCAEADADALGVNRLWHSTLRSHANKSYFERSLSFWEA